MTCPAVIEVVTPGPPGPGGGGAITLTGPAILGREAATPGPPVAIPLGSGLSIVGGALTAAGATNLAYDPATRVLSSSTGDDVTLPLADALNPGLQSAAHQELLRKLLVAGIDVTAANAIVLPHIHGSLAGPIYFHVKNTSGVALAKGTPVTAGDSVGDTDVLQIVATNPATPGAEYANGVLRDDLPVNGEGHAIMIGELLGMNTGPYTRGPVYVGAAGGLSSARPASKAQQVATLGRHHAVNGSLLVGIQGVEPTPQQIGAEDRNAASQAMWDHLLETDPHGQYTTSAEAAAAAPVQSVNGKAGAVVLAPADVGAAVAFAGYQAGRWIMPVPGNFGLGSGLTANTIQALPFEVKRQVRVSGLGGRIATVAAGGNVQFAVYDSTAAGVINAPLRNSASLSAGTAQFVSDTSIASFLLLPGNIYWWAVASDASPVMQAVLNSNPNFARIIGADIASVSGSATATISAYSYAATFGTWPNLSAAATTAITNNRNAYPFLLVSAFT